MKKQVIKMLKQISKCSEGFTGQLQVHVQGSVSEHDKILLDLANEGWSVYRHYVQVGQVQVAILLD